MNQRVLFVDDEPKILEGIQRTLRKRGGTADRFERRGGTAPIRLTSIAAGVGVAEPFRVRVAH
jgi:DNA-binding response OmpR family regulator